MKGRYPASDMNPRCRCMREGRGTPEKTGANKERVKNAAVEPNLDVDD